MKQKFFDKVDSDWGDLISDIYNEKHKYNHLICVINTGMKVTPSKTSVLQLTDEELYHVIELFNEQLEQYLKKNKNEIIKELGENKFISIENILDETSMFEFLLDSDQDTIEEYGYDGEWFQNSFYEFIEQLRTIMLDDKINMFIIK